MTFLTTPFAEIHTPLTDKEYSIIKYFREADESVREMMLNMVGYVDIRAMINED